MSFSDRRREGSEGRGVDTARGVITAKFLQLDALAVASSAKEIHWNSSFLQPPVDS